MVDFNRMQWNRTDLLVCYSEPSEKGDHGVVVDPLPESSAAGVNFEEATVTTTDRSRYVVHLW